MTIPLTKQSTFWCDRQFYLMKLQDKEKQNKSTNKIKFVHNSNGGELVDLSDEKR